MANNFWSFKKISDIAVVVMGQSPRSSFYTSDGSGYPFLQGNRTFGDVYPTIDTWTKELTKFGKKDSVLMSVRAPVGDINIAPCDLCIGRGVCSINMKNGENRFLFYLLKANLNKILSKENGTVFSSVNKTDINNLELNVPDFKTQQKISYFLSCFDEKIEINKRIITNLEAEVSSIFAKQFSCHISEANYELNSLVNVIDNRGKTPPLIETCKDFPIIDVKALNGDCRIIDYTNCTKYVSQETFNTFFRNGHQKINDILMSTVGTLAELKIVTVEKGCIAQNVVAFRCKNISPFYLYEYLKFIKDDLISYNIGSVQPSIKVTHILKHKIYVPDENNLKKFSEIAEKNTLLINEKCIENKKLAELRDTLLPKLMSGDIVLSL